MEIEFDPQAHTLYLRYSPSMDFVSQRANRDHSLIVDRDSLGQVIGVEVLNIHRLYAAAELAELGLDASQIGILAMLLESAQKAPYTSSSSEPLRLVG